LFQKNKENKDILAVEKVRINRTNKIKITPAKQGGLNTARLTLELAISVVSVKIYKSHK